MKGCTVSKIAWVLVLVGALNWGLVGLGGYFAGDWNVVNALLGSWPKVEWLVYVLVGVSALVSIFGCKCSTCKAQSTSM